MDGKVVRVDSVHAKKKIDEERMHQEDSYSEFFVEKFEFKIQLGL